MAHLSTTKPPLFLMLNSTSLALVALMSKPSIGKNCLFWKKGKGNKSIPRKYSKYED
jgi:hypothetical protein